MIIQDINRFKKIDIKDFKGRAVLICGLEKYNIDLAVKHVEGFLKVLPELNLVSLDGNSLSVDELREACETLPVINDFKIVKINDAVFLKKSSKGDLDDENGEVGKKSSISRQIADYIGNLPEGVIILFVLNDDEDGRDPIVNIIRDSGILINFKVLKGRDLKDAVVELFKDKKININQSDLVYFLSQINLSLNQIENEVEKLSFYIKDNTVKREDIDAVISKTLESNIFKMVDYMGMKDASSAVLILNNLLYQRENHLKILGMIIRQYRLLLITKLCLENKITVEEIKKRLGIKYDFIVTNLINQSRNFELENLKSAMEECLNVDMDIKRGRTPYDLSLELLIIKLCK